MQKQLEAIITINILKLLSKGWRPIKTLIDKLGGDRHRAYNRFSSLEKHGLIKKSKRKHLASRYGIFGFDLTEF